MRRPKLRATIRPASSGFAIGVVVMLWWTHRQPPSPLTQGLSRNWKLARAQVDARVRQRFPVGTRVEVLTSALEAEGFEPAWIDPDGGHDEYAAERATADLACSYTSRVHWRVRPDGTLFSVRGNYQESCLY